MEPRISARCEDTKQSLHLRQSAIFLCLSELVKIRAIRGSTSSFHLGIPTLFQLPLEKFFSLRNFSPMIAEHIHDARDQVRRLREMIFEKRLFRGFSGRARVVSGLWVVLGASALSSNRLPAEPWTHLAGWGIVLAMAVVINYGALAWWYVTNPEVRRNPLMLKPATHAVPSLLAGAVITVALVSTRQFDLLFGIWMLMYGLSQTAYRNTLPRGVYLTGLAYMICGTMLLIWPSSFVKPWPMATMFFLGECAGGLCLLQNENKEEGQVV